MPTYVYKARDPGAACDRCRDGFEVLMRMSEPSLETCPACSSPVRRVITPTSVTNKPLSGKVSDRQIEQLGFTKLVKDDDGKYKKAVGKDIPGIPSV